MKWTIQALVEALVTLTRHQRNQSNTLSVAISSTVFSDRTVARLEAAIHRPSCLPVVLTAADCALKENRLNSAAESVVEIIYDARESCDFGLGSPMERYGIGVR